MEGRTHSGGDDVSNNNNKKGVALLTEVCCSVFISNANEIDQQSIRIGSK
jgi:hypothetical protein